MDNSKSRSTAQACAACKFQRRKCGPNCILAPYFPHYRQNHFLNAHRLFGVGRITSMLKPLDPAERDIAVATIMFQSDMRARDPVGGCFSLIHHLYSQIDDAVAQLHLVLQHLAFFRAQARQHHTHHVDVPDITASLPFLEQLSHEQRQFQELQYVDCNPSYLQDEIKLWAAQNFISPSPLPFQEDHIYQDPVVVDYRDQKPLLESTNERDQSDAIGHSSHHGHSG